MATDSAGSANGAALRKWLMDNGANEVQVRAKVVDMMADALADCEISASATARDEMASLREDIASLAERAQRVREEQGYLHDMILSERDAAQLALKKVDEVDLRASEMTISNPDVKDGLVVFSKVLDTVVDTFPLGSQQLTEAVIVSAIEAASYALWSAVTRAEPKRAGGYR